MSASSCAPSIITTLEQASNGASWGADDRIVFAEGWVGLKSVSVGGGEHQDVTTVDISPSGGAHRVPHHVAGHPVLLFAIIGATLKHEIWATNLVTGDARYLLDGISPSYIASGHMVYSRPS